MTEKVKLPKAVCDALDWVKDTKKSTNSEICYLIHRKSFKQPIEVLNEQDTDLIMRALVLGYEPEMTPEERIKERYKNGFRGDSQGIFRAGIREALQIHGIKYDWLEGDLE